MSCLNHTRQHGHAPLFCEFVYSRLSHGSSLSIPIAMHKHSHCLIHEVIVCYVDEVGTAEYGIQAYK